MLVSEFDFELPPELIAQEPLADRAASRMLTLDRATGAFADRRFRDLPALLQPGDLLVFDGLPTGLLLDGQGRIDAELYPNLAELAGTSTWYVCSLVTRPSPRHVGHGVTTTSPSWTRVSGVAQAPSTHGRRRRSVRP